MNTLIYRFIDSSRTTHALKKREKNLLFISNNRLKEKEKKSGKKRDKK